MPQDVRIPLILAQLITVVGLGVVASVRMHREPKIGKPIAVRYDSCGVKPALFAVETGLLLIALTADPFPTAHSVLALYGAFMLTWIAPGAADQGCGEEGVFRGWFGRRYEDLEEWRLTGDHLRFRLLGEWGAVEVPRDKAGHVRSILERLVPERESPHKG